MKMPRFPLALLLIALAPFALAGGKRRSAAAPGGTAFGAHPLHSLELVADTSDLAPLREITRGASIVALGDATHGTREFFTVKLRLIDYLVRELGFDVVSLEAPFAITERLNIYVQTGAGDPRALLREMSERLNYFFWDVEELLVTIEWMRAYNAHRGERPPLELAGADIYDHTGAAAGVLDYLRGVDPAALADAELNYDCVLRNTRSTGCEENARRVRDALAASNAGTRAYADALHYADVVLQYFHLQMYEPRERSMAANLLWIREHRGRSGKVIHWGHQEHVGKLHSRYTRGVTMGSILAESIGREYVAIGTLTGSGSFLQWERLSSSSAEYFVSPQTFPDPERGSYEWHFRQRGIPAMLIPLRGRWVPGTSFRTAATTSGWRTIEQPLTQKLDAVIYVDRTSATRLN